MGEVGGGYILNAPPSAEGPGRPSWAGLHVGSGPRAKFGRGLNAQELSVFALIGFRTKGLCCSSGGFSGVRL